MGAPSTYAKKSKDVKETLCKNEILICDHRDGNIGDDVTLYYPGFQRFIDQCNTVAPDEQDYTFINLMCTKMSEHLLSEEDRQNVFLELMNKYISDPIILDEKIIDEILSLPNGEDEQKALKEKYIEDAKVMKSNSEGESTVLKTRYDGYIDPYKCVILEVKHESGESYAQVIAYYVKSLKEKPIDRCPAPAFLLELVGPHLFISGAVYGSHVFVDRLVDPVWLVPQNQKAMIRIARIFKALKDAIRAIRSHYIALPPPPPQYYPGQDHPNLIQIRHPIVTLHEVDDETAEIDITYKKRIQANMFQGGALGLGNLIIHFVENYNRDVHDLMHKNGLAPEILNYAKAKETRYMAIIMKCNCNCEVTSFADYLNTGPDRSQKEAIFKECEKALATMHREGLCHGNFTHESILIQQQEDKKIFVVNFQFSGKFREERHGMIITPEGDLASLQQIKELLKIQ